MQAIELLNFKFYLSFETLSFNTRPRSLCVIKIYREFQVKIREQRFFAGFVNKLIVIYFPQSISVRLIYYAHARVTDL